MIDGAIRLRRRGVSTSKLFDAEFVSSPAAARRGQDGGIRDVGRSQEEIL
ncbi:MAG TPA: hypothetical protein VK430_08145 [Xanthobacteraceae bacterium]|nr:hypothetical protein [Xanthobacteraceae bacterium]